MKEIKIASSYASALFDFAIEQDKLEEVAQDISFVDNLFQESKEFRKVLRSPVIKNDKKQKIIEVVLGGHITNVTQLFFNLLITKNRDVFLDSICKSFISLYKRHLGIIDAEVTTAMTLTDDTRKEVVTRLSELLDSKIELTEKTNKNIIGGLILTFNHLRFDGSLKSRLEKLGREFDINIYEKGF